MEAALFAREGKRKQDHQQQTHHSNFMQAGNRPKKFKKNGRNFARNQNHQANAVQLQLPASACFLCGNQGHLAEHCSVVTPARRQAFIDRQKQRGGSKGRQQIANRNQQNRQPQQQQPRQQPQQQGGPAVCHNCGQPGHYRNRCPHPQQPHRAAPAFIVPEEAGGRGQDAHFANATRRGGDVNIVNAEGEAGNQLANLSGGVVQHTPPPSTIVSVQPMCLIVELSPQLPAGLQLSRIVILFDSRSIVSGEARKQLQIADAQTVEEFLANNSHLGG